VRWCCDALFGELPQRSPYEDLFEQAERSRVHTNPFPDGPRYVSGEWLEWREQFVDWDLRFELSVTRRA
jgi:hypothetical protein